MKKWLSLAIALMMICTTVMGELSPVYAEETAMETDFIEAAASLPGEDEELSFDIEEIVSEEEFDLTGDEALSEEEYVPETTVEPVDDSPWYARAKASLTLEVDESVSRTIPSGSVLLVIGETGEGLARVACVGMSGAVDITVLERLSDEEYQDFMDEMTQRDEVVLYDDDLDFPLPFVSEVGEEPDATEEPEITQEPETTEEPELTQEPEATEEPELTQEPEATEEPEITQEPEATEEPEITQEPEVTVEPDSTEEPGTTQEPATTVEPENTDAPEATESPESTDEPGASADPDETPDPDATEDPGTVEDPEASQSPEPSETPDPSQSPEPSETPDAEALAKLMAAGVPSAIRFNRTALSMGLKEKYAGLTATVVDANGDAVAGRTVTWRSSNPKVVKVDASGKLTAVKRGAATIYAASAGLSEAAITVSVLKAPSKVTLPSKVMSLSVGMTGQLLPAVNKGAGCAGFTYTSSNPAVAVVDSNGRVVARAAGKTTITVRSFNKKKAKCTVTVTAAPTRIAPSAATLYVAVGLSKINPINAFAGSSAVACSYTYTIDASSPNPACITLNGSGAVTGVSLGKAVVRVKSFNNLETTFAVEVAPAPAGLNLSAATISVGVKETYSAAGLTSLVPPSGQTACATQLSWVSSNPKVATVDANGTIKAKKRGTAIITIATHNGIKKALTVVVRKKPSKLSLAPKALNVSVGMSSRLTPSVNRGAASGTYTYTSSNPAVAQVSAAGVVTGKAVGTAVITAMTYNKKKAKCTVIVTGEPVSVSTSKAAYQVAAGMPATIVATARDASGKATPANYTFKSADASIATVNGAGVVSGVKLGTTTVTVTTHNGKSVNCTVEVVPAPAAIKLNATGISIGVKEKYSKLAYTLIPPAGQTKCAATVTWKTANKKIAKVDANGVITGVKRGTTVITATTGNNLSASVKVVVGKKPSKVTVTPKTLTIQDGQKQQLTVKVNKGAACGTYTFTSSNPGVAAVDANGVVTGISTGTATITAKSYNGKKGTCKVTVKGSPKQVTMTAALTLAEGMTGKVTASALDGAGKACATTFTYVAVNGTGSVTVDGSGKVTAVRRGTATIKVATANGVTTHKDGSGNAVATVCNVTVVEAPASISMESKVALEAGQVFALNPVMRLSNGSETKMGSYTLSVSGDAVTLKDGIITAVNVGSAVVTAKTYNGKTATCTVTVTRRYRFFTMYNYFNVSAKGSLTFPKNNATSFQTVMNASSISGIKYQNLGMSANASKASILSAIQSAFSDSRDSDVSVVYLCSHGYNYIDRATSSKTTHYGLQLPGYENYKSSSSYYITSEEIYNAIVGIKGQVILVLDSCYSGEFITNMKSYLDKQGGRISVMTAASNTLACYYNVTDTNSACDFFTYYLLLGAGYDMKDNHTFSGSMPADSNKDGKLTFTELFNYAKKGVTTNVPGFKSKSWFHGDASQTPRVYTGSNGNLVLFQK